ncbi:MAG: hypothetical protein JWM93_3292 [Frankiales bacterium]|nr:hypothetical protein [Frankiales bacterium]
MRAGRPAGIAAALVGLFSAVSFVQSSSSATLTDGATSISTATSQCDQGTFVGVEANGVALCVHADDSALQPAVALPSTLPGIPCYSTSGPRVHVYYAYKTTNKLGAQRAQLRDLVAQVDAVYNQSAKTTGGTRHVRWVMSNCNLVITAVKVSSTSTYDIEAGFRAALNSGTLGRNDHALIFLDYNFGGGACGYGSLRTDSRSGSNNINNVYQGTAEVANGRCRDATSAAHELGHTLGAVQPTAPHRSYNSHCYDGIADVMCYDDGTIPAPLTAGKCPAGLVASLDCGNDDYFNTRPAAGSYLDTHWNVARSALLARTEPATYDTVPNPTVRITNVRPGATFVGQGNFEDRTPTTVEVNAAGGTIKQVEYYLDGTQYLPDATSAPWDGTSVRSMLDTTGWHNLYAVMRLADGRSRTSAVVRVRLLDDVRLSAPAGDRSINGPTPLSVTLPAGIATVSRVDYTVDNAVVASSTAAPFTIPQYDTSALDTSGHQFAALVYGADGKEIAHTESIGVYVAHDGSSIQLRTSATAGSAVSGKMPVSVAIAGLPAGRTVKSVTFRGDFGNEHPDTDPSNGYSFSWNTCEDSFGCTPGATITVSAEVVLDDFTYISVQRSFLRSAAAATSARVKLASGTRLHAGTTVTVPFTLANLGGASVYAVQVFTRKGYLGEVYTSSTQRSVRVRVPSSWRGGDTIWVRVMTSSGVGSLFSPHVPVTWTS